MWSWRVDERRGDPRELVVTKGDDEKLDEDERRVLTRLGLAVASEQGLLVRLRVQDAKIESVSERQLQGLAAMGLRPVALAASGLEDRLARFADRPVPMGDDELERWRAAGLRVLAVPMAEIERLPGAMPLKGEVGKRWLGEMPEWSELVAGPPSSEDFAVRIPGGEVELPAGRVRLLARAWAMPTIVETSRDGRGGVVNELMLEIVPQHVGQEREGDVLRRQAGLAGASGEDAGEPGRGLLFTRLLGRFELKGDEALVIIAQGAGGAVLGEAGGDGVGGVPTLGQALMGLGGEGQGGAGEGMASSRTRAIVALVPRVGGKLLAGTR